MSSNEFSEWEAYYHLNPFGPVRADMQAALITSTIAQANAPKGKRYKLNDFLLAFQTPKTRDEKNEGMVAYFQALANKQKGAR